MFKNILKSNYSWLSFQEVFLFIINYSLVIILAKLLNPEAFGTVVLLNLYTGVFAIISSLGLDKLIIKDQIRNNTKLSALLLSVLMVAFVVFIMAIIFLPLFLNSYFEKSELLLKYGLLSLLSIFTSALYTFSTALYIRDKKFVKMAKVLIATYTVSFILVVIIAYFDRSIFSLLFKQIIIAVLPIITLLYFSKFKFKLVFSKAILINFFSFSKFITLNNVFNYFVRNIDYFIIGNFFSTGVVGQYSIAYKVVVTPVKMIVKQVDQISFATISKLTNNREKLRQYYISNISLIAQTVFPIIISIIFFSYVIVDLFFDSRYDDLAMIISILSICTLFQSVTALVGNMYIIADKTKVMFKVTVVLFVLQSLILLLGANSNSIFLFSLSYVCAYIFVNFPISNYFALNIFNISILDIIKKMTLPIIISTLVLGSISLVVNKFNFNIGLNIVLIVAGVLLVYCIVNKKIQKFLGIKYVWNSRDI